MKHATFLIFLFALVLLPGRSGGQQSPSQKSPSPGGPPTVVPPETLAKLEAHEGVVFARYGDRELMLDLYRPKRDGEATARLPAIVCIHGGGWWQGDRSRHTAIAQTLAANGYVAATISYRLSGEAPFPAAIYDGKAAVRFLRAEAETYGIDPKKIGAIGLSAGGHLTALLATSGGVRELEGNGGHPEQSSTIQAAVPMGAQTDLSQQYEKVEKSDPDPPGEKPNIWLQFLGGRPSEVPETWKQASPITHLDAADPPMLFLAGEKDNESTHAEIFRARMLDLKIAEDLHLITGAPHAFLGRQLWFDEMTLAAVKWFDQYLK